MITYIKKMLAATVALGFNDVEAANTVSDMTGSPKSQQF